MKAIIRGGLPALFVLTAWMPSSGAQGLPRHRQQPPSRTMMPKRPAPVNHLAEFKAAADMLARQFEVRIVVDPAIWVPGKPKAPVEAASVAAALDQLVIQARKAAWKKVYLKGAAANVLPEKLAESLRALDTVEQAGIVVESPSLRRASTLIKNYEVPAGFDKELEAQQFDPDGIYVLYSTVPGAVAGKAATDRIAEMQRESMELMMQLDDAGLQQAVQQGLDMFMNMDPSMRAKFMGMQMKAGMQAFMNMPPEQRNMLMQEMMGMAQGMFGGGQAPPPGRRP